MDQSGRRMYDKNMYSNPRDPLVSINLALGIWFCLKQGRAFLTYKDLLMNYI
jgi:hypothetical protein